METEETWRPVVGFEHTHEVSDRGRVRFTVIVKPHLRNGYPACTLAVNYKRVDSSVHVLVAAAFIGPRPPGHHVHHKDRNRKNPRVENLEYVSPKQHAALDMRRGSANNRSILTEDDVRTIRATDCRKGRAVRWATLAKQYGVSVDTIRSVRERSSWKHLR